MAVPSFDQFMLPLLQIASDGLEHRIGDVMNALAQAFALSEEDRNELTGSRKMPVYIYRIHWANTYLKKAELLKSTGRGTFQITDRGLQVINSRPTHINRAFLMQFPEFVGFTKRTDKINGLDVSVDGGYEATQTPEEIMLSVFSELRANLIDELLEYILASSPLFFERLVVDLLLAMGYGGALGTGQNIGQAGDGGIDGYIQEDKLGLDMIYIQAKRWSRDNVVGRPTLQGFVGSLMGAGATKGVFITTSAFSKQAAEYVQGIKNLKVILIDGTKLAQLMIEHNKV